MHLLPCPWYYVCSYVSQKKPKEKNKRKFIYKRSQWATKQTKMNKNIDIHMVSRACTIYTPLLLLLWRDRIWHWTWNFAHILWEQTNLSMRLLCIHIFIVCICFGFHVHSPLGSAFDCIENNGARFWMYCGCRVPAVETWSVQVWICTYMCACLCVGLCTILGHNDSYLNNNDSYLNAKLY